MTENVSISSIKEVPNILKKHLGDDFISKKVSPYNTNGLKPHEISKFQSKLHEMHQDWWHLNEAIRETNKHKEERLTTGAVQLLKLAEMLEISANTKNIGLIIERIKDSNKYHSATFELEVLCKYIKNNEAIEIVEEGKEKSTDFIVTYGSQKVCVEAKLFEKNTSKTNEKIVNLSRDIQKITKKTVAA